MARPPSWLPHGLPLLDDRSPLPLDGPFTLAEASSHGVSRKLVATLTRRSLVREVVRGVYAAAQVRDTIELRTASLSRVVSPGAVITDRTAAWLHEVDVLPRRAVHEPVPVDVFSAIESRVRRPGVHSGIRQLERHDITEIHGVALTTGLRTALDLGRLLWRYDAIGALDAFLRWGVPRHALEAEVGRFKGYRGIVQLRDLLPLADPRAESMPESALRLHGVDAELPELTPQVWIGDRRVDLGNRELRYAAEYNGIAFHTGEDLEEADDERLAWLEKRDWVVDEFWKDDVYGPHADPAAIMRAGIVRARRNVGAWRPQGHYLR